MNVSTLNLVPLQQANLCLDCETITAGQTNCHACGSRALLNIARALDQPDRQASFYPGNGVMPVIPVKRTPCMGDFVHST